jgi:hypothetical protein
LVFESKKTVHRIKRYEEKTKSYDHFLENPKFLAKYLKIGIFSSKLIRIANFYFINKNIQVKTWNENLLLLTYKNAYFDTLIIG